MFTKIIDSVNAYFSMREIKRELNGLSDAALADIGLLRADIAEFGVRRAPPRRRPLTAAAPFSPSIAWNAAQPA